jgi:hypothetical protein
VIVQNPFPVQVMIVLPLQRYLLIISIITPIFNSDYRLLLEYVVNEDEATSSAAALALKYVMQTTEGREGINFINQY